MDNYQHMTNAMRRAAQPAPVVLTTARPYLLSERGAGEEIAYYAPRWFRRQNKGRTLAAFRTSLRVQLAARAVARRTTEAVPNP